MAASIWHFLGLGRIYMLSLCYSLRNMWCQQDALWTVQSEGQTCRIWTAAPLPGWSLSTCEDQLSGCHLASPTAGRSKSTKSTGLQRLVIGWWWRAPDKLDDRSTSYEHSPGIPLLLMQEIMQAAIQPVYGEWTVLYSGLYPAGLQNHEGWQCWCYARRRIRYWLLQWHPINI